MNCARVSVVDKTCAPSHVPRDGRYLHCTLLRCASKFANEFTEDARLLPLKSSLTPQETLASRLALNCSNCAPQLGLLLPAPPPLRYPHTRGGSRKQRHHYHHHNGHHRRDLLFLLLPTTTKSSPPLLLLTTTLPARESPSSSSQLFSSEPARPTIFSTSTTAAVAALLLMLLPLLESSHKTKKIVNKTNVSVCVVPQS